MNNKCTVVILTYNGAEHIKDLSSTLAHQTVPFDVIIVDNASSDETLTHVPQWLPDAKIIALDQNKDFAAGYNVGLAAATTPYVMMINQDVELDALAVEECLLVMESDERCGAVAPVLLQKENHNSIDAIGIAASKSHQYYNRGEGRENNASILTPLFGVSGAAIFFRKEALIDVARHGGGRSDEYLDEQFIAYKEDVDISYRLRHRGWKIVIAKKAIAYYSRTAAALEKSHNKRRMGQSARARHYSWRNHLWVILKNEPLINIVLYSPWILWYELRKFAFLLVFEQDTLQVVPSFFRGLPLILLKRRHILGSSQLKAKDIRQLIAK